jgi:hypothetical protein
LLRWSERRRRDAKACDRLTPLDATFLELEEANEAPHGHVRSLMVFEARTGLPPRLARLRRHLQNRIDALPLKRPADADHMSMASYQGLRFAAARRHAGVRCPAGGQRGDAADLRALLNGITIVGSIVGTRSELREVFELHGFGPHTCHTRGPRARAG